VPKNTENIRSKLKRLASSGILAETEPDCSRSRARSPAASLWPVRLTQLRRRKGRQLANRPVMTQDQQLGVLGHLAPGQHHQAAGHTAHKQVEDREDHPAMI